MPVVTDPDPAFMDYGPTWWTYTGPDHRDPRLPDISLPGVAVPGERMCTATLGRSAPVTWPRSARSCTREEGHPGWHAAAGTERLLAEWTEAP